MRYAIGTADDPIDQPGMAATTAALLGVGRVTADKPSFEARLAPITLVSASEVTTSSISWYSAALSHRLDELIEIEADRFTLGCANVDAAALDAAVRRATTDPRYDEADALFRRVVARAVYGGTHPYARRTRPTATAPIKLERACDFVESRLAADAARLTITGNIDLDHTEQIVRRRVSTARLSTARQSTVPDPLPAGRLELEADVERTLVVVSAAGPLPDAAGRVLASEQESIRRDVFLDLGDGAVRAVAMVIPVDNSDQVETEIERGLATMETVARKATADGFWFDSYDSLWFDGATAALSMLGQDPTWRPGEPGARNAPFPLEEFARDRLHVAVIRRKGAGTIRIPSGLATSFLSYGESHSHPDPGLPVEVPQSLAPPLSRRRLENGMQVLALIQPEASTVAAYLVFPIGKADDRLAGAAAINVDFREEAWKSAHVDARSTRFEKTGYVGGPSSVIVELWSNLQASLADVSEAKDEGGPRSSPEPQACPRSFYEIDPLMRIYSLVQHPRTPRRVIGASEALAFRRAHYRPEDASLILIGGFGSDALTREVDDTFAAWKPDGVPSVRSSPRPAWTGPVWEGIADDQARDASITVAFLPASHPVDAFAERMMVGGLLAGRGGGTFGDLLFLLRHFAPEQVEDGARAIVDDLGVLRSDPGAHGVRLAYVRRGALRALMTRFETSYTAADALSFVVEHDLPDDFYDGVARKLASITPEEIAAAARVDLDPSRMVVVARGPRAVTEAALLAMGAPADAITWRDITECP
jgi:predicted Zn-dependent peptidase